MSPEPFESRDAECALESQQHPVSHEGPIDMPALPGELIAGKYRVIQRIGAGGMGQVFSALHQELGERVALKFLRRDALAHPELLQRFATEARACARIRSEHVARVFDVGQLPTGIPFIVMEFLDGVDLADVIARRGPLAIEVAADYLLQVCEALASAHAKGIIHRDIKPGNLFLTRSGPGPGSIKVLDFGVSKHLSAALDGARQYVRTTMPVGSPAYMSPEQLRDSAEVDPRTDVWSLGCTLFELLSGVMPFEAPTLVQLGAAILEQDPIPLRRVLASAPPELEAVILRCLSKDPRERYQSVAELARAVAPFASENARIYAERCRFLLPDGDTELLPHVGLARDLGRPNGEDPCTTAPAMARVTGRTGRRLTQVLVLTLTVAGLAGAYFLGQSVRSPGAPEVSERLADAALELAPAPEGDVVLAPRAVPEGPEAEPPTSVAVSVAKPLSAVRVRAVARPRASAKPAPYGRAADEAIDVGY